MSIEALHITCAAPPGRPQIPRLRQPRPWLRPRPLRPLPPRIPAGLLLQKPLVLPRLPPEKRPNHRRLPHRPLLKCLCTLAHHSLTEYLCAALDLPNAHPALVLTLLTFGEYLDFHPHLHALVADGLFTRDGAFHPLPPLPLKPLAELFRAKVLKLLVNLKLLPPERVQVLLSWKHSGFSAHHGDPDLPEHKAELEQLAQYILRNPFSVEKMTMESPGDTVRRLDWRDAGGVCPATATASAFFPGFPPADARPDATADAPLPNQRKRPKNGLDPRSRRQKIACNDADAKAILPEPRSVKKAISYQSVPRPGFVRAEKLKTIMKSKFLIIAAAFVGGGVIGFVIGGLVVGLLVNHFKSQSSYGQPVGMQQWTVDSQEAVRSAPGSAVSTRSVIVNGVRISDSGIQALSQLYRVQVKDGNYWYDRMTGAWGQEGGPTIGAIMAGLNLGGPLREDASNGDTGVFINGRHLHQLDVARLMQVVQVQRGRFWMDAQGSVGYEAGPTIGNIWLAAQAAGGGGGGDVERVGILSTYDKTGAAVIGY